MGVRDVALELLVARLAKGGPLVGLLPDVWTSLPNAHRKLTPSHFTPFQFRQYFCKAIAPIRPNAHVENIAGPVGVYVIAVCCRHPVASPFWCFAR
jgi:hypothetical protein